MRFVGLYEFLSGCQYDTNVALYDNRTNRLLYPLVSADTIINGEVEEDLEKANVIYWSKLKSGTVEIWIDYGLIKKGGE